MEQLHQLRDLVHDHFGPRRTGHELLVRVERRRARRDRDRLADPVRVRAAGGVLDGRADISVPDRRCGPYWWAAKLGGKGWSWFTGWFNIVGLVGIVAGVGYGAASSSRPCSASTGVDMLRHQLRHHQPSTILHETFLLFLIILIGYTVVNIFADRLLAIFNNISVGWHVLGVLVIIALVAFVPSHHQSLSFVFGQRLNNTGFHGGATSGAFFWLYILPLGFILTMYTQTGYDASAHTAEETRGAAKAAAQGVWRSVFYSAIAGWALLLALLFAATHVDAINKAGGGVDTGRRERPERMGGEVRADHLHRRAAVLRGGGPDERVAHVVRVLARPRDARVGAVPRLHQPSACRCMRCLRCRSPR